MEYIEIKEQIKQKLPVARDLGDSENLLELGLSSLTIMRLVNQWRKQGVKVSFGSLMENPTLEGWWALIQRSMKKKAGKKRAQESKITPEKDMKQPFPLTDVQYAYWVGRDEEQALGGIDCHAYLEFDGGNIDPERLEKAWNVLQYHHPMLRACFLEDGTQKILDKPYCEKIKVHDFSRMPSEEAEAMAVSVRERLSHRKLKIEEGEVAGIELTLFPENRARMHVDMALLVADVQSLQILLRDLAAAYRGESLPAESKGWNFASYLERQKEEDKEERNNAEGYWKKRLEHLPKGPGLPLAKRPQEVTKTVFNRRIVRIGKEEWAHLQVRAKEYQTTPAMVLLTAYATVLERWSRNHRFLINIPFFNRKTEQQGLEDVIADFTTLLLLEIDCEGNPTFAELLDRIQKQLHEDMKYTAYSGVQVQRDIAQMCGDASAVAPVVFACNLGTPLVNDTFRKELGQFSYMISQTPQVWNDFQSYEDENGVQLTWDSVDKLFPENMIPDMLECFENLLHELGKKDWNQRFDVLPEKRKREIEDTARTGVPERVECLHWAVMNHAEVCPEDIALIDAGSGRSVSYGELKARATAVAAGISEKDIKGVPVALTLPRGIEQIEAALGILLSGNSYLPVSLSQPKDRRALIHEKTGVRYVVTNRELSEKLDWPEGTEILVMEGMEEGQENVRLPEVSPKDSAYIIMTSGSTGVPKGVEIAHESAWNTVQDINEKYHVTSADRALAVSAMDFDLSVYDVFGILGAGGTLVLLPEQERRNADYWLEQVLKYQITVWNSVPVLLDMLLIRAESMKQKLPIRAVMLSGDWIGMDLPQRVAAWTEDCQFVAMGGATEASIWSNYQNVTLPMPKNWKSIPYGKPLRYQAYRVVDEYGRDCPYWAEGELWIGGFGVAKGYRGDSALTGQKFITDQYGRWYRTGDLGRIWDDETIEFLGRKDHQVKIRGHRIELGEIEHAIQEFPGVAHAVVDTVSDGHGNKTLAAYIGAPIQEDSKVTTYLYGTDIFGGGWKELKDDVSNWQMQQERKTAYKNFLAYADQRCVQLMLETLIELGVFVSEKEVLSQKEIFEKGSITETQKNTVARWLEILKKEGILREEDGRLSRTGKEVAVPEKAGDTETYFNKLKPYLKHMVTGNEVPLDVFYQKEPALAPNMLLRRIPGCEETVERLVQGLRLLAEERRKEPLQIIEIGTRDTAITRQFLNALEDVSVAYTYADSSKYFLQEAEKELAGYERVEFEMLNLEEGMDKQQMSLHSYDVVISVNALHRNIDAVDAVKKVAELLKPNGILLMTDLVVRTYLQELTAAFLENGFADIRDKRKEAGLVTPDCLLWRECLSEAGLGEDCAVTERYGRCICCSRQQASVLSYHNGALREYLSEKLPEYMVPQNYHFMEQLPTLSNGKINRKQLREDFKEETAVIRFSKATTETEEKLLDIWKQLFGYENIGIEDNYFSLGGDSLIATRLISEVQKTFGCKITISTIFENLTVKSLAKAIEQSEQKEEDTLQIKPNLEEAYHPFPLTDVQYAYWLGRSGLYELGNVATHCYFELDADGLDTECAETAWNLLIQRHGMMRVIIQPDGMQRILENTPQYHIDVTDIRQLEVTEKEKALDEKRAEMSHQVIQTDEWPLFDVRITKIEDQKHRIHISFDNIIFDGWSMFHLLNEWAEVYRNGKAEMPITLSFRDYVLGLEQIKSTSAYEKDKKYWEDRVETFADAPDLPLAKNESQITEQRFCRRSAKLSQKEWQSVKDAAGRLEVTPSVLLMSAYAETLRLWSSNKDFTLNLTQFDRKQLHPEVNNLVGDFTTLTLLEIKNAGNNFAERTKAIQKQLTEDLEHTAYGAVELERELKKKTGNMRGAIMPVVFTSMLGMTLEGMTIDRAMSHLFGEPCYVFTQTPQVWLDHQVMESDGELMFSWYCMDNVLEPGAAEAMFNDYCAILQAVIAAPESLKTLASGIAGHIPRRRWPLSAQADYDLRDIEQAAQEYPGIQQARAELSENGALTLDIVVTEDPPPSAPLHDEHDLASLALPLPEQAQLDELEATWRWLEARALQGIAATLNRHGLFTTPEIAHRFSAIVQALSAQASHQRLLRQWLQCLTEREWLIREGESWRCRIPLSEIPEPQEACPQSQWSQALAQYLETCIARHDALFSGQCSPLELLFNEQHRVTDALYRDNPASACLNRYTAQIAALCSAERILEVGAGTAATTAPVLKATRNTRQSYHFTDVSAQFLNDARARFHDESQVSYALFDINQPLDFTAHPEAGYDLIVAVNVLHDASHVVQTLRRLKLLLKAGGRLLIVEATERNSVFQLASVGFIEGLSGYRDFRRRDEKPMLTRSAWQEVLVQAGFANELAWPAQESSPLRQHLLVARSPGVNRPDKKAVSRYLQQRFGTGLPILQIRQREALFTPLHAPSDAPTEPAKPTPVAGGNPALEKQVAELWQSLLSRPVARHHDFFELGGDSLMATRMVAQLNRRGIARANLQDLFNHSTLSDFCAHLQAATSGEDNPIPLCQGDGEETLFVFHASDGDISAWLPLASALNRRVFGLQAKSPQRFATLDQMIDEYVGCIRRQQPHGPYVLAGWSYGAFLAAGAAQRLYAKGEQVRMVLIDPVCRQDFCCENRAALLRLLAEGQTPLALPEHFDQQTPDSQLADFISLAKTAGMVSQNLTLQAAETWLDNIAHLLRLLTEHTPGESVPVPCLMVYAAGRPARWTPAETEWQGWINNADDAVIEASHWQIMMEAPHVQACAQHITRWLCATSTQPENTL